MSRFLQVTLGIALLGMYVCCEISSREQRASTPAHVKTAAEQQQDANVKRAWIGAKQLKAAMRNPDSFRVSEALVMDSGAVCYEYRAQNGFGGMNVERAILTPLNQVRVSSQAGFAKDWKQYCMGKTGTDAEALLNMTL